MHHNAQGHTFNNVRVLGALVHQTLTNPHLFKGKRRIGHALGETAALRFQMNNPHYVRPFFHSAWLLRRCHNFHPQELIQFNFFPIRSGTISAFRPCCDMTECLSILTCCASFLCVQYLLLTTCPGGSCCAARLPYVLDVLGCDWAASEKGVALHLCDARLAVEARKIICYTKKKNQKFFSR